MDWNRPMRALIPGLEGAVLRHLWRSEEPRTASQVHLATREGSLSGIRRALDRLVGQGVVVAHAAGHVLLYRLNTDHLAYPAIDGALQQYRPRSLLRARMAQLVDEQSADLGLSPSVAIYGSVARGDATVRSDLDVLLVVADDAPDPAVDALAAQIRLMAQRWTGNPVHVFTCTPAWLVDAARREDPLVESWLADAETVYGTTVRDILAMSR